MALSLETLIQIEKECEKRNMTRTQFIKEAIGDKLKNLNIHADLHNDIKELKDSVTELRKIMLLMVEK